MRIYVFKHFLGEADALGPRPRLKNHCIKPGELVAYKHLNHMIISQLIYLLVSMKLKKITCSKGIKYAKYVNVSLY